MERKTRHDDPATGRTIAWGIVGAILVFVLIVGIQAFFYSAQESETRVKTYAQAPEELSRLTAVQQEILNSYRWIDQENGVAAIPIERAMEIVAREIQMTKRSGERAEPGESR